MAAVLHLDADGYATDGATGKVGIGTDNPGIKLEVNSGGSTSIAGFFSTDNSYNEIFVGQDNDEDKSLAIGFNPTNKYGYMQIYGDAPGSSLIIANGGNVGIGTTNPGALLDLGGGENGAYVQKFLLLHVGNARAGWGHASYEDRLFFPSDGHMSFGTISLDDGSTWAEKMRITNAGNVGIGTTNPGAKLHVNGNTQIDGDLNVDSNTLFVKSSEDKIGIGTNNPGERLTVNGNIQVPGGYWMGATSTNGIYFDPNNTLMKLYVLGNENGGAIAFHVSTNNPPDERMRINKNGNVGIGTNNPINKLHIRGGGGTPTLAAAESQYMSILQNSGSTGDVSRLAIISDSNGQAILELGKEADSDIGSISYDHPSNTLSFRTNNASNRLIIDSVGNIGIGVTNPGAAATTNGVGSLLHLANATTNPEGSLTGGGALLYASGGELYAMDAAGNINQISPHDPKTGEWIFYSKNTKTGRTVRVEMEKLVKKIEELTGEKFLVETWAGKEA